MVSDNVLTLKILTTNLNTMVWHNTERNDLINLILAYFLIPQLKSRTLLIKITEIPIKFDINISTENIIKSNTLVVRLKS